MHVFIYVCMCAFMGVHMHVLIIKSIKYLSRGVFPQNSLPSPLTVATPTVSTVAQHGHVYEICIYLFSNDSG